MFLIFSKILSCSLSEFEPFDYLRLFVLIIALGLCHPYKFDMNLYFMINVYNINHMHDFGIWRLFGLVWYY